jgi:hypothetical protein
MGGKKKTVGEALLDHRDRMGKELALVAAQSMSLEELLDWATKEGRGGGTVDELREKWAKAHTEQFAPPVEKMISEQAGAVFGSMSGRLHQDLVSVVFDEAPPKNPVKEEPMPTESIPKAAEQKIDFHIVPMPQTVKELYRYLNQLIDGYEAGNTFRPLRIAHPVYPDVELTTRREVFVFRDGIYAGSMMVTEDLRDSLEDHDLDD